MIQEQLKKEVSAGKRIFRGVAYLFAICWGIWGLALIITPAFPLGIIFIAGAVFVLWRLSKGKTAIESSPKV
jgi:hypothetical protein